MSATPLAGLKVLEFSHTVMGPTAGLIFAELGADVVKIEPAPNGDHTRGLGGFAAGFFAAFSRDKRSLALDLKRREGQAVLHRLAATTDVVLENYGPGTMERLRCGYEHLAPLNPRLIYLALKGYLAGPYEHRPALDEVVQFQTGLAFMTGPPGRPLRAGASVIDMMGAVFGVVAVLLEFDSVTSSSRHGRRSPAPRVRRRQSSGLTRAPAMPSGGSRRLLRCGLLSTTYSAVRRQVVDGRPSPAMTEWAFVSPIR
jgi:crotonobetainyl-CoA:carnitine CoA-transferase CaiB-like acyl-CoA transferase